MKEDVIRFVKGFAMGGANVIPGVSGGTIAFITGIYERLIEALKSFDLEAVKLALRFKLKEFAAKTDLRFLAGLAIGIAASFLTLARVLDWGFKHHETAVWAFFWAVRSGQFDDLDTPAVRILLDEDDAPGDSDSNPPRGQ